MPESLSLPSGYASSSSWAQSIPDHRCTVPLSNPHGLCSCPSIQGPGRSYRSPTVCLNASDRTWISQDCWWHKSKGVKKTKVHAIQVHFLTCVIESPREKHLKFLVGDLKKKKTNVFWTLSSCYTTLKLVSLKFYNSRKNLQNQVKINGISGWSNRNIFKHKPVVLIRFVMTWSSVTRVLFGSMKAF